MAGTANKIWLKIKSLGKEIFLFLSSRTFLKNFFGIFTFFMLCLILTFGWLKCYTKRGESIQVHNYVDLTLEDAVKKAKNSSFSVVVNDSMFVVDKEPNIVLEQSPKALSKVKENRTIYLTISKSNADLIKLPQLVGGNDDYANYENKLKLQNIRSRIVDRKFDNVLQPNTILEVIYDGETITEKITEGFKVPKGGVVDFIVSERSGGKVSLPNLVCKRYEEVNFMIKNYNLNLGTVIEDATVTDKASAYVHKQVPAYRRGKELRFGEQVNLYLTQYKPDGCSSDETVGFNIETSRPAPVEDDAPNSAGDQNER